MAGSDCRLCCGGRGCAAAVLAWLHLGAEEDMDACWVVVRRLHACTLRLLVFVAGTWLGAYCMAAGGLWIYLIINASPQGWSKFIQVGTQMNQFK